MSEAATTQKSPATAPRLRALLAPAALQKLLAFASLVLLLVYFSIASPAFMQTDNMINILQATAVNGVLAIASTFVIITAGIDLSVGSVVVFFGGELRGEFTKDQMQEEDIAHVAVTGAPVASVGSQTSMETS